MQNLSEPAVLNLPSFVMPNPFEPATSDFPESAMTFRQSFMQNRSETVAPNRPEVSASDLVPVFSHFPHIRLFSFLFRCQLPFSPYSCFRCSPLCPHSLLFPIFPQSRPASSGFTPASVLYPYTAFALISDFPPIPLRFFRFYSCFRPLPLYLHLFLLISSLHIHFFMLVSVPTFLLSLVFILSALPPLMPSVFLHCFRFRTPVFTSSAFVFPCSIPHPYPHPPSLPLPLPLPLLPGFFRFLSLKKSLINFPLANDR